MTFYKKIPFAFVVLFFICANLPANNKSQQFQYFSTIKDTAINPLVEFSTEWSERQYLQCNTAESASYLSKEEKKVIWILNMIRVNPQLFLNSVLLNPKCNEYKTPAKRNHYFNSLISDLEKAKPIYALLSPDADLFKGAYCHAYQSGLKGRLGHSRAGEGCEKDFYGECCDYGNTQALDILLSLLIDEDVPSLGHRKICLSDEYTLIAVSIQPHKKYGTNTVLDFK